MGPLTHVHVCVDSVRGKIVADIRRSPVSAALRLTSPPGTHATVSIPVAGFVPDHIAANGRTVWASGRAADHIPGLAFVSANAAYVTFTVAPGAWQFAAAPASREGEH